MSLNWNLTKIVNKDELCWIGEKGEETLNPVTEALIWLTMEIDIGRFTEKNIGEVIFRLRVFSRLFGKPLTRSVVRCLGCRGVISEGTTCHACTEEFPKFGDFEYYDFSQEEVRAHIGLSTNVGDESRAAFFRNVRDRLEREIEREIRNEREEATTKKETKQ